MSAVDPRIGTRLAGYLIEALLGSGGMGVVYRAEDQRLGRRVALKLLPPELAADLRFRERFLEESRLAASIEHPNIIPVHDAGEAEGVLYIAMRWIDGSDLGTLLAREGTLGPPRALRIAEQVASALDAAHARGLVHRDVKPGNILVAAGAAPGEEHAYLCDFGVSKRASAVQALTRTGQLLGTPNYLAPEQIEGGTTDPRADVYALAAVLFECLAGTPPYARETEYAVLWAKLHEPPPSLVALRPELPPAVDRVLAGALARRPEDRCATCGELVSALRSVLGESGKQRPQTRDPRLEEHYRTVAKALLEGRVVPLVGTGANVYGRAEGTEWQKEAPRLPPDAANLADHLAASFGYPTERAQPELARVSQFVTVMEGSGPLHDELHRLFDADYAPGRLHAFLAWLPSALRTLGGAHPLILTANYDQALESAFAGAGEPFDVVSYIAAGRNRGKFLHLLPDGSARVIDTPNAYAELSLAERTVIMKVHGQVDRGPRREWESFVVTEDDHIEYLAQSDISSLVPVTLAATLRRSHFLFFGFDLLAWSLRAVLHRIWGEQTVNYKSWAIQPEPTQLEREFWRQRSVDLLDLSVEDYLAGLREHLDAVGAASSLP